MAICDPEEKAVAAAIASRKAEELARGGRISERQAQPLLRACKVLRRFRGITTTEDDMLQSLMQRIEQLRDGPAFSGPPARAWLQAATETFAWLYVQKHPELPQDVLPAMALWDGEANPALAYVTAMCQRVDASLTLQHGSWRIQDSATFERTCV